MARIPDVGNVSRYWLHSSGLQPLPTGSTKHLVRRSTFGRTCTPISPCVMADYLQHAAKYGSLLYCAAFLAGIHPSLWIVAYRVCGTFPLGCVCCVQCNHAMVVRPPLPGQYRRSGGHYSVHPQFSATDLCPGYPLL